MGRSLDQYEYLFNTLMLFLTCTGSQFSAIYVSVPMVASIILFCTSNGSTTTCKSFFVIILSCDHLCDAVVFA